ncbi:hypothetical protein AK812_SmicGene31294 [Symbiodinium microadriaticum]|uniref:Reverse transcriptase domain-containing protein n=1 Tax=Symbiodinium microadriaticum TaxID=2951 RepID=A0A1Q9CX34_SYMMI|nr:hypothetical protein AK812_SmicGene31294 [Symbiodinium microadriaticum]
MVPRWALSASLHRASVPADLHDLILDIHQDCLYRIKVGEQERQFPMQRGIRQGCSLSPLLFAIFTGWLYDELCSRVGQEWADEFITLYADDSLLQWIINSTADLDHMCRCIRSTFDLLTSTGMQVNAAKSQLIIQLQGATGKRWLKAHLHRAKEGFTVSVGTPSHPIYLPRVSHFTYLGVVASLGSFEMQTCKHRLRAGAQVRHRLLRVLHSAGLRVRQRAILYQACVRSSFLYGQHAVGVTFGVLRKLEAQDAKNLRGIARSPAHLWHERSQTLRARLGLRSVHHMLVKLYQNRGEWQARLADPCLIVDSGPLLAPIPVEVQGLSLLDELLVFQDYARRLGYYLQSTDAVRFPPALGPPDDSMHEAEHAAACYLLEGSGSLWSAVVSLLPFRDVKRQHQPHPQSQFSAGAYGHHGFAGLCKQTEQFGSVLRLLNLLICSLHSGFSWTTVLITVNNVAGLHVDRQNASTQGDRLVLIAYVIGQYESLRVSLHAGWVRCPGLYEPVSEAGRLAIRGGPTGDIVPAALPAFALEANDTALDAKSTYKPVVIDLLSDEEFPIQDGATASGIVAGTGAVQSAVTDASLLSSSLVELEEMD